MLGLTGCWVTSGEVDGKLNPPLSDPEAVGSATVPTTDSGTDDDTGDGPGTTTEVVEVVVLGVEPAFGTVEGGDLVTVQLGDLGDSEVTGVRFGDRSADIVDTASDSVTVLSPSSEVEGWVDIAVDVPGDTGVLEGAYHYWLDGQGLAGAAGAVYSSEYVGDYWEGSPQLSGYGWFGLIRPTDFDYRDLYVADRQLDHCELDFESAVSVEYYDLGVSNVSLSAGGSPLLLSQGEIGSFAAELDPAALQLGAPYALQDFGGGPEWSALQLPATVVELPDDLQITSPVMDGSSPPEIDQSFTVRWSGSTSDYVLLLLTRQRDGLTVDDVNCVATDDGAFDVPGSIWSGWAGGDLVTITVARVKVLEPELLHNGSTSGVVGMIVQTGAAYASSW